MVEKELLVYIDGNYYPKSQAKVSVYDHGLLYGDGVFEGIRVYDGKIFMLEEHISRLFHSANAIMLTIPLSQEQIIQAVVKTVQKNEMLNSYVRLVVTRGRGDLGLDPRKCGKPTIIIIADKISLHADEAKTKGITTLISWVRRNSIDTSSPEIKSLNYLNSIMAKIEANMSGVDEAICLDKNGTVAEGVGENLFIIKDGDIFTPPCSTGALAGITSKVVIDLAKSLGYSVKKTNITPFQLFSADEAFFTGTAAEIIPISHVNWRKIGNGIPGVVTQKLIIEFKKLLKDPSKSVIVDYSSKS